MVAELPEDLVHFERPENRFNQDGGTDGTLRDATVILGKHENVIPKAGFQVGLQLRQIEIWSGATLQQFGSVVEEVQAKVKQPARHGQPIHLEVAFHQVPAAGADQQHGSLFIQAIDLTFGAGEADFAANGIAHIALSIDHVFAGGRTRILEIGHKHGGTRVQGVDDHLAVGGAGDFGAAILQIGRDGRDGPFRLPDVSGFGQKVGKCTGVDGSLPDLSGFEQFQASHVEAAVQFGEEILRLGRQYICAFKSGGDVSSHYVEVSEFCY